MDTSIESTIHTAGCTKCGKTVKLTGRLMIGEVFDCGDCGAPLEVARLDPLRLVPFARIEEEADDFADFDLL